MSNHALQNTKGEPIRPPAHTQGTLHRRLQPLNTEKHTVSCSGFLPNTTPMQHSCSHYNAFCSSIAMWCIVMWCIVIWRMVMWCIVMRCIVMWCIVTWCIVMWCILMWCIVMWCIVMWYIVMWYIVMWCIVMWCIDMWCIVAALHFIRNSEDWFSTSFDHWNILGHNIHLMFN